ncbi:MAG: Fic family protein [Holosporaceae bacterium]|jgi:Fic family protein|nr:Fic family protein [Holosporaceae bacterium]
MQPFIPHKLPVTELDWEKLVVLIGKATELVSLYNGLLKSIPNANILLSAITTQEAVLSSRIEGTQASLSDVYKFEASGYCPNKKNGDIGEIINYRRTLFRAMELFEKIPNIHLNMLKELHLILLSGTRGSNKALGEFRRVQNFIGVYGATIEQATYVPPSPENVLPALDAWEKYINSNEQQVLVQSAVLHAQFEIIHPFLEGNGRLGRILIPLFFYQKGLLREPVFYVSKYLEEHRDDYYQKLRAITQNGDWQSWIEFFLQVIIEQARVNVNKAENILDLYKKTMKQIKELTHSSYIMETLNALFQKPIFSVEEFMANATIKYKSTALDILKKLEFDHIIENIREGRGRVASIYAFSELIDITE